MARLGCTGNINFTASSWGVIDLTAAWAIDSEAGTLSLTTSTSTHISPAATPGVITVDGVYLKISSKLTTGTLTVVLRNTTAGSDVISVVVNVSDLPATGWCFFKFASSQLLLAATNYAINAYCSSSSQVTLYRSTASAQEFTRLIRTTTTAAPGAGDQMLICKELTGAGTDNGTYTVTMDNTASTIFGATTYTDSVGIGKGGILTYGSSSSTAYLLKVAGLVTVWDGGTWNQGTSGTRIPSTSSAKLVFSVATNIDSGFIAKAGSTVNRYGNIITADSTLMTLSNGGYCTTSGTTVTRLSGQAFTGLSGAIVINGVSYTISSITNANVLVLTGSAGSQSPVTYAHAGTAVTLTVASTTGWANGDTLAVASTSQTATDCEQVTISTVDSSTQVTLSGALTVQHSGDSPTQAEVIHLTRNVSVEGTSTSLQAFVQYNTTAVVNDSYCSFQYLGSGTSTKRGIDVLTTTGSYTAIGCIVKDSAISSSCGWFISGSSANNISITYSHTYNLTTLGFSVTSTTTGTAITLDHCICMKSSTSGAFNIAAVNNTFTNLTAIGTSGFTGGITFSANALVTGTISGITAHSNNNAGLVTNSLYGGTISTVTVWRNGSSGVNMNGSLLLTFNGVTGFGNNSYNFLTVGGSAIVLINGVLSSDIIFSTNYGTSANGNLTAYNSTFGVVTGIKTAHTAGDIVCTSSHDVFNVIFVNCLLASSTEVAQQTTIPECQYIRSQDHDQVAGVVKRWGRYGTADSDTVTYKTASPAETLTPNNASFKFAGSETQPIAIDNGQTATVTVYVNKSASYNGNQPRLLVRRNDAVGIAADTVVATASGGTGSWLTLSGTVGAATANGAFVCYVDCDGTAGTVSIDDWSVA